MIQVVTFATPEYAGEIEPFRKSAEAHGFDPACNLVDSRGSWRANVGMKPRLFLSWLDQGFGPYLFVDVDGRIKSDLAWLDLMAGEYDFGCWFIPWDQMRSKDRPGGAETKNDGLASGTVWINNTWLCREFLQRWIKREKGQHRYGQIVLGETWHFERPDTLRTLKIPQRFCHVFDRPWKRGEHGPVEIEHTQASRRLRKKVG